MSLTGSVTLTNARIVLPAETVHGTLRIEDGLITDIDPGPTATPDAIDCDGDLVAPGLIELHTDNLERHMSPRPGVKWPRQAAILAHDAELAGTGITTVFDAIRVGSILTDGKSDYGKYARDAAHKIHKMRDDNALKISHFLHLRAEICSETLLDEIAEFGPEDRVGIVSLMDHTPGQRQFADISKYREYMVGKYHLTEAQFDEIVQSRYDLQARVGAKHEACVVAESRRLGAILASHDDTTEEHVRNSAAHGAVLAEFPTTTEAASACQGEGISVMMGAPNLMRGGSHSGNVSAGELADRGFLDILSSDYVPASLLIAAVRLGTENGDIAKGLATVTEAPARAAGLEDRGRIAEGLRGDVIRIRLVEDTPVVRGSWVRGYRVA